MIDLAPACIWLVKTQFKGEDIAPDDVHAICDMWLDGRQVIVEWKMVEDYVREHRRG